MIKENIEMLTWAMEHPYLYFGIMMKPAIVAVAMSFLAKAGLIIFKERVKE